MPEEPKTVKVFARIRPTNSFAYNNIILSNDQKVINLIFQMFAANFAMNFTVIMRVSWRNKILIFLLGSSLSSLSFC